MEIDDADEIEETEKPAKKTKASEVRAKKAAAKAPAPPAEPGTKPVDGRIFNGGARKMPEKPPGVARSVKARTFEGWVSSLTKRETPPHHFVLELQDGESKMIGLTKSRSGSVLVAECVSTIETFEPVKVEAFSRDEVSDEEMSLGQWVFPKPVPAEESVTTEQQEQSAIPILSSPPPGYLPNPDDSEAVRMLKTFTHLLSDAYRSNAEASISLVRHNADANKNMLDAMSRVMEMQANAFARERESIDRTVQTREKLAKLNAARVRIATSAAGASEIIANREDEEEEETEEANNEELFGQFLTTFATEFARSKATQAAKAAAMPDPKPT